MDDENDDSLNLTRPPTDEDLANLCAKLNQLGAQYIVVGGLAIIAAGYTRATMDIDLLVDVSPENDAQVREALESLPEKAILEVGPGEIANYVVVRVCDEFTVDLMAKACGMTYDEAKEMIVCRDHLGVRILLRRAAKWDNHNQKLKKRWCNSGCLRQATKKPN